MDKQKTRDEVNSKDRWKIELIYKDENAFLKDFQQVQKELEKLIEQKENFTKDSKSFACFFKQDEKVSRLLEKLYTYAKCRKDEDQANSTYQELEAKMTNIYAEYEEKTAFVIPDVLKLSKDTVLKYLQQEKDLENYHHFFDVIFEKDAHILDENTEKVLSAYGPVLSSASTTASYLTNADLVFDPIYDGEKELPVDQANYAIHIRSKNRKIRKDAFLSLHEGYKKVKNTLTSTYTAVLNYDAITARLRNYKSSIAMYLQPKHIPVKLYENLIEVVHQNLPVLYDYYDLKKKMLGLEEFHLYDSYLSTVQKNDKEYSFEEAKKIVLEALSVYGREYHDKLQEAFSHNWIDKYPNKGKRSGAYSMGCYDTIPYVLLNYTNTYTDVSTLAHELGHSMHTYYANKNNSYIEANYPIFLAEIASTTNELLLGHCMYQKADSKAEKLSILNEKLDLFKASIFRQAMFAEFEYMAHCYVDDKNVATVDYLCEMYYQLNKKYFGDGVVVDEDIQYEWLRIPHFYSPFYVYQYATSLAISCYVVENIIKEKEGFQEKYIEFLSSGGRDFPLEVLKIIDIDLADTKVFESAMKEFENTLEEFKKVYNEME